MDCKSLKQDMTYALKKLQKDGKVLTAYGDNLTIDKDTKTFVVCNEMDPLEAFVIMKAYEPTAELLHTLGYNISLLDLLVEQTGIAKSDWYSFLDGFDNVLPIQKNDFYILGVYIRDKFVPTGMRTALEQKVPVWIQGDLTTKFVVHNLRGKTNVVQVRCEEITPLHTEMSFPVSIGEKVKIHAPDFLLDRRPDGKLVPSVWFTNGVYDTEKEALAKAKSDIRSIFERDRLKKGVAFTEEDVQAKLATVRTINF